MREESQLDDMRSAIRGDFERLARRRGSQDLMRLRSHEEPETTHEEEGDAREPRSWLARLLAR